MNLKTTLTTAVALALGTSMAFAGGGEGCRGMHREKHRMHGAAGMARMAEKLSLTDAQKAQLKEQRANFRASNVARFETHQDTIRQYREARKAGDQARAEQLKATLEIQKGELQQLRKAQHEAMLSILTPEQRTQLAAMKAEHKGRRGEKRHHHQH